MFHNFKLLITLSILSIFLISCSSTKLEVPQTEGEELKILYDQALEMVSEKISLMLQLYLKILKDNTHILNGQQSHN